MTNEEIIRRLILSNWTMDKFGDLFAVSIKFGIYRITKIIDGDFSITKITELLYDSVMGYTKEDECLDELTAESQKLGLY